MPDLKSGTILKSTGSWYRVSANDNRIYQCRLTGKHRLEAESFTNPLAVGDFVKFIADNPEEGVIKSRDKRRNSIVRRSNKAGRQFHVIAANVDQLVIIATLKYPRTSTGFIDRLLLSAETEDIPSVIIYNKKDLWNDAHLKKFQRYYDIYTDAGYEVISTSAERDEGIDTFRNKLLNKVSLLCGHSGTGKSTLLNKINSGLNLKTKSISKATQKGKHATTFVEMHHLDNDTFVIDAPGIKDFGLTGPDKPSVGHFFPDIEPYLHECKFNDCLHQEEPGCHVKEQVEKGVIPRERYDSYLRILNNMN